MINYARVLRDLDLPSNTDSESEIRALLRCLVTHDSSASSSFPLPPPASPEFRPPPASPHKASVPPKTVALIRLGVQKQEIYNYKDPISLQSELYPKLSLRKISESDRPDTYSSCSDPKTRPHTKVTLFDSSPRSHHCYSTTNVRPRPWEKGRCLVDFETRLNSAAKRLDPKRKSFPRRYSHHPQFFLTSSLAAVSKVRPSPKLSLKARICSPSFTPSRTLLINRYFDLLAQRSYSIKANMTTAQLQIANSLVVGNAAPYGTFPQVKYVTSVRLMISHCSDEGLLFTTLYITDNSEYSTYLQQLSFISTVVYPADCSGYYGYTMQMGQINLTIGDVFIVCNDRNLDGAF